MSGSEPPAAAAGDEREPTGEQLLQQVLRAERAVWPPPGGWAAGMLIPCSCMAAPAAGLLLTRLLRYAGVAATGTSGVLAGAALAALPLLALGACQVMVAAGHDRARSWMLRCVRVLLVAIAAIGIALPLTDRRDVVLLAVSLGGLAICHVLLTSRAYRVFTRFQWLRRLARLQAKGRGDEVDRLIARREGASSDA